MKEPEEPLKLKNNITETQTTNNMSNKIKTIETTFELANKPTTKLERGEDDWYVYAAMLHHTNYLKDNFNISTTEYKELILQHIIEYLTLDEVNETLDYLYFTNNLTTFEKKIKKIYDNMILKNKGIVGILLSKENKQYLLVKGDTKWSKGESEDYTDLSQEIEKLAISPTMFNRYVGFIGNFKNEYNIFKVKDMEDKRGKGARCDQSGKSDTFGILNHILDKSKYTSENTKGRKKIEFCVIQELLLRFYNKTKKDNKIWFLNPSEAIVNNI